ncbi:MAG: hypothetical protein FWH03_06660 [Firmicutes bacterium]|nr:hypothetical protein [Bacillota bacterium]
MGTDTQTVTGDTGLNQHAGTVAAPLTYYPALAQDADIAHYEILNDIPGHTNSSNFRATQALEDMLFINPSLNEGLLNGSGVVSYTVGGATYTTNFSRFFKVETFDLFLPYAVTARMTPAEYNYALNNDLFSKETVAGMDVIRFDGLEITPLFSTVGVNFEIAVVLTSPKAVAALGTGGAMGGGIYNGWGSIGVPENSYNVSHSGLVTARMLVSVASRAVTVVDEADFDSFGAGSADFANGRPAWHKHDTLADTFDVYMPIAGEITFTPYDFADNRDVWFTQQAGYDRTDATPRGTPAAYAAAATQIHTNFNVATAVGANIALNASAQRADVRNDRLTFIGDPTFGVTQEFVESGITRQTATAFDEIKLTAIKKSRLAVHTSFTMVIGDNGTGDALNTVTVTLRVFVINSAPYLKDNISPEFFRLQTAAQPGLSSNNVDGGAGESVVPPNLQNPLGFTGWQASSAYNTRQYFAFELATDPDLEDIPNLEYVTTAGSIQVGTLTNRRHMMTNRPTDDDFVPFAGVGGLNPYGLDNPFVNADILSNGSGLRSEHGSQMVLNVQAKSSTQGLEYGLWIRFVVTDRENQAVCYIQIEVLNSVSVFNTGAFATRTAADAADDANDLMPAGSYLSIQATLDTSGGSGGGAGQGAISPARFLVSDEALFEKNTSINVRTPGGATSPVEMNEANSFLLANNPDGVQHVMPLANGRNSPNTARGLIPTIPIDHYASAEMNEFANQPTDVNGFPNYKRSSDFMRVFIDDSTADMMGLMGLVPSRTLGDYLNLTYFEKNLDGTFTEVDHRVFPDQNIGRVRNLHWVVTVRFGTDHEFEESAVRLEFFLGDSNQVLTFDSDSVFNSVDSAGGYTHSGVSGYGNTFLGVRSSPTGTAVTAPSVSIHPTNPALSNRFILNVTQSSISIINNFTEFTAQDNVHGVLGPNERGNPDSFGMHLSLRGGNPLTFGRISVPVDRAIHVPYAYFATTYVSGMGVPVLSPIPGSVGLASTNQRDIPLATSSTGLLNSAFANLTLSDGVREWTGATFRDNPYITVEFVQQGQAEAPGEMFLNSSPLNPFYVGGRKILAPDATLGGDEYVQDMAEANLYLDARTGLRITKKHVRSDTLTFSISVAMWRTGGSRGSPMVVTVPMTVENSFIGVEGIGTATQVGNMPSVNLELDTSTTGSKTVGFISSQDGDNIIEGITSATYGGTFRFNNTDTVNIPDQPINYTLSERGLFRDRALFSAKSLDNSFLPIERERLFRDAGGGDIQTNSAYASAAGRDALISYFSRTGTFADNVIDSTYQPNLGYNPATRSTDFFAISLSNDASSFTITPRNKTFLNFDVITGMSEDALRAEFGLEREGSDGNYRYYYPLRLIAYDDFNGTGWAKASYYAVCIKVFVYNSAPVVMQSLSTGTWAGAGAYNGYRTMQVNANASLTGGTTPTEFTVSSMVIENDAMLDYTGQHFASQAEVKATYNESTSAGRLGLLTTDWLDVDITRIGGLTQTNAEDPVNVTNNTAISLTKSSDMRYLTLRIGNRPADTSTALDAAVFAITFKDSRNNANTLGTSANVTRAASIIMIVRFNNLRPSSTVEADRAVGSFGSHITMKTGDTFRIVTTDYEAFRSGGSDEWYQFMNNRTMQSTGMSNNDGVGWWRDESDPDDFFNTRNSSTAPRNTHIGNLPVATDDTPWALRFDYEGMTIAGGLNNVGLTSNGRDAFDINTYDRMLSKDPQTGSQRFPLTIMFEALGSTNAPIEISIPVFDEQFGNSFRFFFYVTVVSSPPAPKNNDINIPNSMLSTGSQSSRDAGLRMAGGLDGFQPGGPYIYEADFRVGQSYTFNLSDFVYEIDAGDSTRLALDQSGGGLFNIEGINRMSDNFVSLEYMTDGLARFTVTCNNFHLGGTGSPGTALYSVIRFDILDPGGAPSVRIYLRARTWPNDVEREVKSIESGTAVMRVEADALNEGGVTTIQLVAGAHKAANENLLPNNPVIVDRDFRDGFTNARYNITAYSLLNISPSGVHNASPLTPQVNNASWRSEHELFRFRQGAVGTNPSLTFGDSQDISVLEFWKFVDKDAFGRTGGDGVVESFARDGSSFTIRAEKRSPAEIVGINAQLRALPIYIVVEKHRDPNRQPPASWAQEQPFRMELTIKNSAAEVVGSTSSNFQHFGDGYDFLEFNAQRGSSRSWRVFDPDQSNNAVLFKDVDLDDSVSAATKASRNASTPALDTTLASFVTIYKINPTTQNKTQIAAQSQLGNAVSIGLRRAGGFEYVDVTVNFRPQFTQAIDPYPAEPTILEYKIVGRDLAYNRSVSSDTLADDSVYTVITVIIHPSVPSFWDHTVDTPLPGQPKLPDNMRMERDNLGQLELIVPVRKGTPTNLTITDILNCPDFAPTTAVTDTITFITPQNDGFYYYGGIDGNPNELIHIAQPQHWAGTPAAITNALFTAQVLNANNSVIRFNALTTNRGETAETYLIIRTGARKQTEMPLKITLVTANNAPTAIKDADTIYVKGGELEEDPDSGMPVELPSIIRSVLEVAHDLDDNDHVDIMESPSQTFLRFAGPTDLAPDDPGINIGHNGMQSLVVRPEPDVYGTFKFAALIADGEVDGHMIMELYRNRNIEASKLQLDALIAQNSMVSTESKFIIIEFTVIVIPTVPPVLNNVEVAQMTKRVITANTLIDLFDEEGKQTRNGDGFVIHSMEPAVRNTTAIRIYKNGELQDYSNPGAGQGTPSDVWEIMAVDYRANNLVETLVNVTLSVQGDPEISSYEFKVIAIEHIAPRLKGLFTATFTPPAPADAQSLVVRLSPNEIFDYDYDFDLLSLIEVRSQKTIMVVASIDRNENQLVLRFNGRGDSRITLTVRDGVRNTTHIFTAASNDLPQMSWWARLGALIQANWLWFWIAVGILIFLIILLIIIIAAVRKKRRIRAEIEDLLVAEMELEAQMKRLVAKPAPTYYQSYGYISPTQNVQHNPGFMLGAGGGQPAPRNTLMLGAGQAPKTSHGQTPVTRDPDPLPYSIPGLDDDDL